MKDIIDGIIIGYNEKPFPKDLSLIGNRNAQYLELSCDAETYKEDSKYIFYGLFVKEEKDKPTLSLRLESNSFVVAFQKDIRPFIKDFIKKLQLLLKENLVKEKFVFVNKIPIKVEITI